MTPTRLVLWDVDRTLLVGGGVGVDAYRAASTAVTGVAWHGALVAAGRTDRTITPELFAQHGLDATGRIEEFLARYTAEFADRAHELPVRGHLLPGVAAVLAALHGRVVQTLVTGNIAAVGVGKVTAFGLHPHLDTSVGGYGDDPHTVRADLVRISRSRAEATYGAAADDVLVVGDTVLDVGAALSAGVVAVGVATGPATAAELADAGAHHVLDDLSDVEHVVSLLAATPPDRGTGVAGRAAGPPGGHRGSAG